MTKNIIISAGGTGGHLAPALAVAQKLAAKEYKVILYTDYRCEGYLQKNVNYQIIISKNKVRPSKKPLVLFKAIFFLLLEIIFLFKKILSSKTDLVITFGGYTASAVNIVAILTRKKLILHEQNSVLGLQNKVFAPWANYLAYSFPNIKKIANLSNKKMIYTGIPVECNITTKASISNKFTIVITGGSQGASFLDKNITNIIKDLDKNILNNLFVIQQVRKEKIADVRNIYQEVGLEHKVQTYFLDIKQHLARADLVISRAGAGSLAEICYLNKAAIIIPYPYAKDNHQYCNAAYFAKNNAAIMLNEKDFEQQKALKEITSLINNINLRKNLIANLQKISDFANNKKIISLIDKLCS
jgi:UDP-N-acetylglucosamine--N-acetylmuramyl-(pentapeptide) pyrophosphoryl-undecaprenol N-acetylglucosamine transferase